jgi:predicted dienelactone hydrolase
VVKVVVDFALTLPEVDAARVALLGWSLGGYLAPRAASGEHRLAACISDCGPYDLYEASVERIPPYLAKQLVSRNRLGLAVLRRILQSILKQPTHSMRR